MKKPILIILAVVLISFSFSNELSITPSLVFPSTLDFNYNGGNKVDTESMFGLSLDYLYPLKNNFLVGIGGKFLTPTKSNQSGSVGNSLFSLAIPYFDFCYVLFQNSPSEQEEQGLKETFLEFQTGYPFIYNINQTQFHSISDLAQTSIKPNYFFAFGLGTEQNHIFANILYTIQLFQLSGINSSNETVKGTLWFPATQLNIGYTL